MNLWTTSRECLILKLPQKTSQYEQGLSQSQTRSSHDEEETDNTNSPRKDHYTQLTIVQFLKSEAATTERSKSLAALHIDV